MRTVVAKDEKSDRIAPVCSVLGALHSQPFLYLHNYQYYGGGSLIWLKYHVPQNPILICKAPILLNPLQNLCQIPFQPLVGRL